MTRTIIFLWIVSTSHFSSCPGTSTSKPRLESTPSSPALYSSHYQIPPGHGDRFLPFSSAYSLLLAICSWASSHLFRNLKYNIHTKKASVTENSLTKFHKLRPRKGPVPRSKSRKGLASQKALMPFSAMPHLPENSSPDFQQHRSGCLFRTSRKYYGSHTTSA